MLFGIVDCNSTEIQEHDLGCFVQVHHPWSLHLQGQSSSELGGRPHAGWTSILAGLVGVATGRAGVGV